MYVQISYRGVTPKFIVLRTGPFYCGLLTPCDYHVTNIVLYTPFMVNTLLLGEHYPNMASLSLVSFAKGGSERVVLV